MMATTRKTITGQMPVPMKLNCSVSPETGWPLVYHLEMPRADTIMPSVAMKGGIFVLAISWPLMKPASRPTPMPTPIGTMAGRSVSDG
ncbi:hypothetical protein D3C72_2287160 [compost metagenome]